MKIKNLQVEDRLHHCPVPLIGLTGGLSSGKSSVGDFFRKQGIAVLCADTLIHKIYEEDSIKRFLEENLPHCIDGEIIDFGILRKYFFENLDFKDKLENLLYQFLPSYFIKSTPTDADFIIYEMPLLFEKNLEHKVDLIITVVTTENLQRERAIKRDLSSSRETINNILKNQLPLEEKKKRSQIVIENDGTLEELEDKVKHLSTELINLMK